MCGSLEFVIREELVKSFETADSNNMVSKKILDFENLLDYVFISFRMYLIFFFKQFHSLYNIHIAIFCSYKYIYIYI